MKKEICATTYSSNPTGLYSLGLGDMNKAMEEMLEVSKSPWLESIIISSKGFVPALRLLEVKKEKVGNPPFYANLYGAKVLRSKYLEFAISLMFSDGSVQIIRFDKRCYKGKFIDPTK